VATTDQLGLSTLSEKIYLLYCGNATGVTAKNKASLRILHIILTEARHCQRVDSSRVGLYGKIRHGLALFFRQNRPRIKVGNNSGKRTSKSKSTALFVEHDSGLP
jgi:hypothetical protein